MTAASRNILSADPSVVARYQRQMRGELFRPGAVAAEVGPSTHDSQSSKQPVLVARCLSAHDVAIAIALARELELERVVRGGHNHTGQPVDVPFMLIDLSQLRQIIIDPLQQIARVQPGATSKELVELAAAHGFASSGTILAFEIITAEGATITASAHEHADAFVALCGSSGTVGIVTAIIYRLRVLPPEQENSIGDDSWTSR